MNEWMNKIDRSDVFKDNEKQKWMNESKVKWWWWKQKSMKWNEFPEEEEEEEKKANE